MDDTRNRRIELFHGTTESAAKRISTEGWKTPDIMAMVGAVADQHGEDRAAVWDDLRDFGYATGESREGWVSFASTMEAAARWAQRAPEARREALCAVWRLRHPTRAKAWVKDGDCEEWVFRQMLGDPPAVVVASVPLDSLFDGGFSSQRGKKLDIGRLGADLPQLPEIQAASPAPVDWVIRVEPVARRVHTPLAAELIGLDFEAFVEKAKAGVFGPYEFDPPPHGGGAWWSWDRFSTYVDRRSTPTPGIAR